MDDLLYILISSYVVAVICKLLLPEKLFPKRKRIKKHRIWLPRQAVFNKRVRDKNI